MSTPTWNRALVTGASSGIGASFARLLAAAGTDLVIVARSTDALDALASELREAASVEVEVITADLTDDAALAKVMSRLGDLQSPVDLLVNNAGYGRGGAFHELDADDQDRMIKLNVNALVALTHAAIPAMKSRGRGGILNVASMVGLMPTPYTAVYGATKAFVISFSEALHEEVRKYGIHVTSLNPGFTRTNFAEVANVNDSMIPDLLWMEVEPVVEAGLEGIAKNRAVVSPGANAAMAVAARLLPSAVLRKATAAAVKRGR